MATTIRVNLTDEQGTLLGQLSYSPAELRAAAGSPAGAMAVVDELLTEAGVWRAQRQAEDEAVRRLRAENDARVLGLRPRRTGPCPCECNRGGFCGGCGHAGCGGRR